MHMYSGLGLDQKATAFAYRDVLEHIGPIC